MPPSSNSWSSGLIKEGHFCLNFGGEDVPDRAQKRLSDEANVFLNARLAAEGKESCTYAEANDLLAVERQLEGHVFGLHEPAEETADAPVAAGDDPIPEAPIPDAPIPDPMPDAPIPDAPIPDPIPDAPMLEHFLLPDEEEQEMMIGLEDVDAWFAEDDVDAWFA